MSCKKQLLKEVFHKAQRESGKSTKNGLAEYLALKLEEKFDFGISERSLNRYYNTYVSDTVGTKEIEIDSYTLDKMSEYIGYKCFGHYSNPDEFILDEVQSGYIHRPLALSGDFSKIAEGGLHINIQNIIRIPDFIKNNKGMGLGIVGLFMTGGTIAHFGDYFKKKDHMYWNGAAYSLTNITDQNPKHKVLVLDSVNFKYFKKITRTDTLSVDHANKVYYSKFQNKVAFFTMDGVDPENNKELKPATAYIIRKYAGKLTSR